MARQLNIALSPGFTIFVFGLTLTFGGSEEINLAILAPPIFLVQDALIWPIEYGLHCLVILYL